MKFGANKSNEIITINRKRKEFEYLFHSYKTIVNSFDKVQFIEIEDSSEEELDSVMV